MVGSEKESQYLSNKSSRLLPYDFFFQVQCQPLYESCDVAGTVTWRRNPRTQAYVAPSSPLDMYSIVEGATGGLVRVQVLHSLFWLQAYAGCCMTPSSWPAYQKERMCTEPVGTIWATKIRYVLSKKAQIDTVRFSTCTGSCRSTLLGLRERELVWVIRPRCGSTNLYREPVYWTSRYNLGLSD